MVIFFSECLDDSNDLIFNFLGIFLFFLFFFSVLILILVFIGNSIGPIFLIKSSIILVLSNFIPTIYFGVFTGIAMLLAMISVLTLLPKLILTYKPFGKEISELN